MKPRVFIDGNEGTTGLELSVLLNKRADIEVLEVDQKQRKDLDYKRSQYEKAELVVLCLPDEAAREAVALSEQPKFLDASSAHRVADGWVYGLPELSAENRNGIKDARYVSNPGCYPTGFLLAIAPLVKAGIVRRDTYLQIHAVSGYSGGGKKLIAKYKDLDNSLLDTRFYALKLQHKHVPEMQRHGDLVKPPFFLPSVGPFYRGMVVSVALPRVDRERIYEIWCQQYAVEPFITVHDPDGELALEEGVLSALRCNPTNRLELLVSGEGEHTLVCAILDNLGKGAAHAAIQNLNLMLGMCETAGLRASV